MGGLDDITRPNAVSARNASKRQFVHNKHFGTGHTIVSCALMLTDKLGQVSRKKAMLQSVLECSMRARGPGLTAYPPILSRGMSRTCGGIGGADYEVIIGEIVMVGGRPIKRRLRNAAFSHC
jgi:hypothetical protein